mgnify:CR=1 FL=1
MKKSLTITGRVELSREEITKGIIKFLKEDHQLAAEKIVYELVDEASNTVKGQLRGAVIYVHQDTQDESVPKFGIEPKETRKSPSEPVFRRNVGVNGTIRSILNDVYKNRKETTNQVIVNFDALLQDVVFQHQGMDDQKLRVYLYDRRQLPHIDWLAKSNQIVVKGIMNHY